MKSYKPSHEVAGAVEVEENTYVQATGKTSVVPMKSMEGSMEEKDVELGVTESAGASNNDGSHDDHEVLIDVELDEKTDTAL